MKEKTGIPVLMYHEVTRQERIAERSKVIQKRYLVEDHIFESQLSFLAQNGYESLTVSGLLSLQNASDRKIACITFDDGYEGNYTCAYPALMKHGFKATFFVTTNWMDRKNMLSWQQLREMKEAGMEIGSHGKNHTLLSDMKENDIVDEVCGSMEDIRQKLDAVPQVISCPSGSYSSLMQTIAQKAGYKLVATSDFGYWEPGQTRSSIPRLPVFNDVHSLERILKQDRAFIFDNTIKAAFKDVVKSLMGRTLYDKLYFKVFGLKLPVE
mgnify:CR=1 FL=1